MDIHYDSPQDIAAFLKERNLWLKKRFGQNFLVNPGARKRLIDLLELSGGEDVWEIGPGIGSLTVDLLDTSNRLTLFEIDRGLVRVLKELFPGIHVIEGDVIKTWPEALSSLGRPDRLIGNLPYSSGAAIILSFIRHWFAPERMVLTLQREQARRLAARPGDKSYSSFSVLVSALYGVEQAGDLQPGSFFPRPEVVSRIVVLTPRRDRVVTRRDTFFKLTEDLFRSRRKTIKNNLEHGTLAASLGAERILSVFRDHGVALSMRAEELPVETIASCAEAL